MNTEFASSARILSEHDSPEVVRSAMAGGTAVACSCRCPGKQSPNEDAAAMIPVDETSGILLVADGVGGGRGGAKAATLAATCLKDAPLQPHASEWKLRSAILDGMETANQRILEFGLGAATTLAVVELFGNVMRSYHVGDSMALVVGRQGKIKLQTISHSPVGFAVEAGFLDEAEAMHHDERHIVSNVVGSPNMRIEIGPQVRLAPRDTVLVASDGLFDNMHIEEIVEHIRKGPLDQSVQTLVERARARMQNPQQGQPSKPDDLTVVAYRRSPRVAPQTKAPRPGDLPTTDEH